MKNQIVKSCVVYMDYLVKYNRNICFALSLYKSKHIENIRHQTSFFCLWHVCSRVKIYL